MTDIEKKALALMNEVRDERGFRLNVEMQREDMAQEALCRAIERHEAFRQEVSDAVGSYIHDPQSITGPATMQHISRFIIAKPDPLAECLLELDLNKDEQEARHDAEWLVKTIEKRGGKLTWGER